MEQEISLYASRQLAEMLTLLRDELKEFVEPQMEKLIGPKWRRNYPYKTRGNGTLEDGDDTAIYLKAAKDKADKLFGLDLASYASGLCLELLHIRNESAHQAEFSPGDVYRAWDTAERLLTLVSSPQAELAAERRWQAMMRLVPDLRQELHSHFGERLTKAREERREIQEEYDAAVLKWSAKESDFQEIQRRSKGEVTRLESELGITRRELESVRVQANELATDLIAARERLAESERQIIDHKNLALKWQQQIDSQAQEIGRLEVTLEKASAASSAADQRLLELTDECQHWREIDEAGSKEIDTLRLQLQAALRSIPPKYTWDRWVIAGFIAALIVTAGMTLALDRAVAGLAGVNGLGDPSEVASASGISSGSTLASTQMPGTPTIRLAVAQSAIILTSSPTPTVTPTPTMTPTPKPTVTPTPTATPTPTPFTYPTLAYNYDTRKDEGWERYKKSLLGLPVRWTGIVTHMPFWTGDVSVDVGQNNWWRDVTLELGDSKQRDMFKLGDRVTFSATISYIDYSFGLETRLANVSILQVSTPEPIQQ